MPGTRLTTVQQRQQMAHRGNQGAPYQTLAYQNQVSYWTVRKWVRRARQGDLEALVTRWGRPTSKRIAPRSSSMPTPRRSRPPCACGG